MDNLRRRVSRRLIRRPTTADCLIVLRSLGISSPRYPALECRAKHQPKFTYSQVERPATT
ncbi:hypothetical protein BC936DRAFT_146245 [Jimgerdemannia flammicorona]|uniref:Uncharacterized protein n=1 Tax=Jimgerdemannia flammicorona TaxID=994334 RepID=A0A433DM36_9FUNG|nr:hypothetical protein BC936DRAFT_146245 [Jimgerdemannia flammicorona]